MPKAFWNGAMIAQSNLCRVVRGKYYFPTDSIRFEFLRAGATDDYFDIEVDGEVNPNAAWRSCDLPEAASGNKAYIAFGDQVSVVD